MSNVIRFLESMGRDAAVAKMSAAEYAASISFLDADDMSRVALLQRDSAALIASLNARDTMYCAIACPDDDKHHDAPGEDDDMPDECPPSDE